jgi:choline dehydrogenase-like flavoprotein
VVDTHAKVIGVKGLRVVDASSFALLPPGHPQSMVCEYILHGLEWLVSLKHTC